jgi:hypothetical protein
MIVKNKYATYIGNDFASKFRVHAQKWTQPDAPAVNNVLLATALTTLVQTVTAAITQPDFPRVLSITGTKTGGGSLTGNVVINGTDIRGNTIANTIALNDNATVNGTKAFKTITNIVLPVKIGASDTVSVGLSDKLGLEMIPYYAVAITAHHGATLEGTLPTITLGSATDISLDIVDFNSACGADHDQLVVYYTADQPSRNSRTS